MPPTVVVAGEALVDLVPDGDGLVPIAAGSPVNVAVGLGRLGVPTTFCGALSTDAFGDLLTDRLGEAGVGLELVTPVAAPTTLAVVHLDADGHAAYGFYLAGTSAAALTTSALPQLPADAALHVSFGAVGPTSTPAGTALCELIRRESGRRVVSLDPNVRPSALGDHATTLACLEDLVSLADVVKVSEEDLALLRPGEDAATIAARWATTGPCLVVVTRGADGADAWHDGVQQTITGREVSVTDTVGAGDAFTTGLLASLLDAAGGDEGDGRSRLRAAGEDTIRRALEHAVTVAASTCTRPGADPPWAADLHPA